MKYVFIALMRPPIRQYRIEICIVLVRDFVFCFRAFFADTFFPGRSVTGPLGLPSLRLAVIEPQYSPVFWRHLNKAGVNLCECPSNSGSAGCAARALVAWTGHEAESHSAI
jgi:hypothetical protein